MSVNKSRDYSAAFSSIFADPVWGYYVLKRRASVMDYDNRVTVTFLRSIKL